MRFMGDPCAEKGQHTTGRAARRTTGEFRQARRDV
jgi:hypothetical protein